eukprot:15065492-Ditylum_brightwellii.AAC.1
MEQCYLMVSMMVLTVLTSTSHISHKRLIADKHLAHLSQAADCCMTERSKQNEHLVCDEDDDVDDIVDDGNNDSVDGGDDDGVDDGADDAD